MARAELVKAINSKTPNGRKVDPYFLSKLLDIFEAKPYIYQLQDIKSDISTGVGERSIKRYLTTIKNGGFIVNPHYGYWAFSATAWELLGYSEPPISFPDSAVEKAVKFETTVPDILDFEPLQLRILEETGRDDYPDLPKYWALQMLVQLVNQGEGSINKNRKVLIDGKLNDRTSLSVLLALACFIMGDIENFKKVIKIWEHCWVFPRMEDEDQIQQAQTVLYNYLNR